jgi:glucokinase-like ROK family protein
VIGVKGDPESARFINRALVLKGLKSKDSHSRAALARQLGLSKITISQIVADLIAEGLIEETGEGSPQSTGGRKPILLTFSSSSHFVIGLDIGVTNTVVALAGLKGERLVQLRVPTNAKHDIQSILTQVDDLVGAALTKQNVPRNRIVGVGISIGGLIENQNGFITFSPDFGWQDVPFRSLVENRLNLPVTIDNCTRVMAFGEKWQEQSRDAENIFYINLGYGIGSAIVMHGRIYNNNSEFGHIRITNKDVLCDCGKKGCLEAVASGHAIERLANTVIQKKTADADYTAKDVAELASTGNEAARQIFRDASRYLGRAISIAATLFNPDRVVIAGGVASARELIEEPLMDEYNATTMDVIKESTQVTFSSFGIDAGIIGALSLALNKYIFHEEATIAAIPV